MSAAAAFFECLPKRLAGRPRAHLTGALSIFVQGEGAWTVRFDAEDLDVVSAGGDLDASCVAVFSKADFDALLAGQTPRQPVVQGAARLLGALGQLLAPPARGALGAKLSAAASANVPSRPRRRRKNA